MTLTMYLAFSDELSTLHCKLKNYLISTVYSYAHIWDVANESHGYKRQQKQFQRKLTWIIHSSILQFLRPITTGLPHFYFLIITNLLSHINRTASFPMPSNCLQTTDWAHFLASHQPLYQVHTNAHSVLGQQKGFPDFLLPSENKRL